MMFSGCMTDTTPCSVVLSDMADPSWNMSLCVIARVFKHNAEKSNFQRWARRNVAAY